jgi:energy-coupling factor transport system ATP-binding protein
VIRFDHVTITYPEASAPALQDLQLEVDEGELCVVVGATGSGKSTLLGAVNGLVPHFTGGHLAGEVTVAGRSTRTHPPRELADVVGVVGQDPLAGFVTDTVEEELAYAMEQLAVPPATMRRRVEETLDLLGIADLRARALRTLSGGQQQRVAIGSVLTLQPKVLVLDEPTSALDPTAAEEVLAAVTRLVHDLGITVLMAEHRLERVVQYADRIVEVADGRATIDDPAPALATTALAPPIVHLGRLAGWSPLPLSVRDARRHAPALRVRLEAVTPPAAARSVGPGRSLLEASGLVVRYGDVVALREVDLSVARGEVVAVMGRNGSGKSSLLWAMHGAGPRAAGQVTVAGVDPAQVGRTQARALAGLVPQTPADLLYLATVQDECAQADRESGGEAGRCRALLDRIVPGVDGQQHPRDLSEGQRLGLVLAVQLSASPQVILLDEPTRGLDHLAKERLATVLAELAADGRAVVVSTHDVEFVATVASRVVVLAEGEVVADGPTAEVVVSSPAFAPQVAKVLQPQRWLTVAAVAGGLAAAGAAS